MLLSFRDRENQDKGIDRFYAFKIPTFLTHWWHLLALSSWDRNGKHGSSRASLFGAGSLCGVQLSTSGIIP